MYPLTSISDSPSCISVSKAANGFIVAIPVSYKLAPSMASMSPDDYVNLANDIGKKMRDTMNKDSVLDEIHERNESKEKEVENEEDTLPKLQKNESVFVCKTIEEVIALIKLVCE